MNRSEDEENGLAIIENANELRSGRVLVDVVLVVNGQRLDPCHKFMLAASSPYFRAMFSHGMIEEHKNEIEIKGVDKDSLGAIIEYIYTGKVTVTDENAQGLLIACSLLQMSRLYRKCREYMIKRLDYSNCISMFQFSRMMCCVRLQNEALGFIARKFQAVSAMEQWCDLTKDELIEIISSDDLWIENEEIAYEAALSWLVYDVVNRSSSVSEVLSHIRFALISESFIDNCILAEVTILDHPSLRIQIEAAKSYIASNRDRPLEDTNKSDDTEEVGDGYPFYLLPIPGHDTKVKVSLNVKPRAGMDTKEFLLFTNGRRTFAMNPTSNSEYYGCLDTPTPSQNGDEDSVAIGWSPEIPVMKNPEAHFGNDGSVFLLGGLEIERTTPLNVRTRLYRLDSGSLNWLTCESMPSPRCMAAYGDGCGYFYVMGGKLLSDGKVALSVIKYSTDENKWSEGAPMPLAVYGHCSTSYEGKIFVSGGKRTDKTVIGDVLCLDCRTDMWTSIESMSTPRFLHGMAIDPLRKIFFVVGGSNDDGVLDSVEEFNFSDKRWKFGESFPGNRCAQYVTEFDGEIQAVGGYITERTVNGKFESREMHDVFVLENSRNKWSRKVRRIRGMTSSPMACVKVRLHTSSLPRASVTAGVSQ